MFDEGINSRSIQFIRNIKRFVKNSNRKNSLTNNNFLIFVINVKPETTTINTHQPHPAPNHVRQQTPPCTPAHLPQKRPLMKQELVHIAIVVKDYDEAIEYYTKKLDFDLIEDTYQPEQDKRWVVVAPKGSKGCTLLLARASNPEQETFIGNQCGGRVFLFLNTDDFWRDYNTLVSRGVTFVREPKTQDYGIVAVFEDLYGNRWDLLQLNEGHRVYERING